MTVQKKALVLVFSGLLTLGASQSSGRAETPQSVTPVAAAPTTSPPWDGARFSATPAELLRAAANVPVPEGEGTVLLLSDIHVSYDAAGRSVTTYYEAIRIVAASGVGAASVMRAGWSPWSEERPRFRARVITTDGVVHSLDAATLSEQPAQTADPTIFTDRKLLSAPLPAVQPGAIIEQEVVIVQHQTPFDGGTADIFSFSADMPALAKRLVIEAPSSLPLRFVATRVPAPQKSENSGTTRLVFELRELLTLRRAETNAPIAARKPAFVALSTGRSWSAVASRYAELLNAQLRDSETVLPRLQLTKKDRRQLTNELLQWLHKEVRYTGVELGQASLTPQAPAETLRRKYGDCKDQATLLIALLRAAGVPAQLALLRSGDGLDVDPELPGLGLFNHAIVYVPATGRPGSASHQPAFYVDPTASFAAAGQLPPDDSGRLALLIADNTKELVRTPEIAAAGNTVTETVEVAMREYGPGRIVETTEMTGASEIYFRNNHHRLVDSRTLKETYERYAHDIYKSEQEPQIVLGDPAELATPFHLQLTMERAGRAQTGETDAGAALPLDSLFDSLPRALYTEPDPKAGPAAPRTQDFSFFPIRSEIRWRVVPPPGYALAALPKTEQRQLGTMVFTQEFSTDRNGVVTGRLVLDAAKGRLTPDEFRATQQGLLSIVHGEMPLLRFDHKGAAHLQAGRIREALGEYRQLIAQHPAEALHRSQLAMALSEVGLGGEARRTAAEAVARDPGSAYAQRLLGMVLLHDELGQQWHLGWDRPGALAALRRAVALEPTNWDARFSLAQALEHDAEGDKLSAGEDVVSALAEYLTIWKNDQSEEVARGLLFLLMRTGQAQKLRELADGMRPSAVRDAGRLASMAMLFGGPATLQAASTLIPANNARSEALESAARSLMLTRHYTEGLALMEAALPGSPDPAKLRVTVELLRKLHHHEETLKEPDSPAAVVRQLFRSAFLESRPAASAKLFATAVMADEKRVASLLPSMPPETRSQLRKNGLSRAVFADFVVSLAQLAVEGDDVFGYQVRVREAIPGSTAELTYYVIKEAGGYRIRGDSDHRQELGREALALAERGNLAGAQKWLDWAREGLELPQGDDPLRAAPFLVLWSREPSMQRDLERARVAAAALACTWTPCEPDLQTRVAALLTTAQKKTTDSRLSATFDLALASLYLQVGDRPALLSVAQRLLMQYPESERAFAYKRDALASAGRQKEAQALVEEQLVRRPESYNSLTWLARSLAEHGEFARAAQIYQKWVSCYGRDPSALNGLAWNSLFVEPASDKAVDFARRAADLSGESRPGILHTLATLYAETGKTREARETLLAAINGRGTGPLPIDYYVLGRLAEQYGELDAARDAYRRVTCEDQSANDTCRLAQRRLPAVAAAAP